MCTSKKYSILVGAVVMVLASVGYCASCSGDSNCVNDQTTEICCADASGSSSLMDTAMCQGWGGIIVPASLCKHTAE